MRSGPIMHTLRTTFSSTPGGVALLCSFSFYKALAIIVCTESFLFPSARQIAPTVVDPQIVFFLACATVCIVVAVFLRKSSALFAQDWYAWLMLLSMLVGMLLLFLRTNADAQDVFSQDMCLYLGIGCLALGFMGVHIEFGRVFGHLGMARTLAFGVACSCIGGALYFAAGILEGPFAWLAVALYAVVIVGSFSRARRAMGKAVIYGRKFEEDLQVPYRFMSTSLLQGLSFGSLYGALAFSDGEAWQGVELAGLLGSALLTALVFLVAHVDFNRAIYQVGFPLIAVSMLCSSLVVAFPTMWVACQVTGFLYLDLALWALGSYLIKDCDQPSTWVASCPTAMLMIGRAVGIAAGGAVGGPDGQTAWCVGAFAIVLASLLLSNERNIRTGWGFICPGDSRSQVDLSATCEVVAKEYLLTPRELEVLKPLVQGDDAQDIAGRLYISPNTVKSHIQNIYNKLGVHSRKELLRVVESRLKLLESR